MGCVGRVIGGFWIWGFGFRWGEVFSIESRFSLVLELEGGIYVLGGGDFTYLKLYEVLVFFGFSLFRVGAVVLDSF